MIGLVVGVKSFSIFGSEHKDLITCTDGVVKVHICDNQKRKILFLDEITISLCGEKVEEVKNCSLSKSTIMITGNKTLGEMNPPHFQLLTNAKENENENIWIVTVNYSERVV